MNKNLSLFFTPVFVDLVHRKYNEFYKFVLSNFRIIENVQNVVDIPEMIFYFTKIVFVFIDMFLDLLNAIMQRMLLTWKYINRDEEFPPSSHKNHILSEFVICYFSGRTVLVTFYGLKSFLERNRDLTT